MGRRVERNALTAPTGTSTTRFTHDGADVIRDTDANGVTTADWYDPQSARFISEDQYVILWDDGA